MESPIESSFAEQRGGTPIDILQLLDELEDVVGAGWPVPGVGRAMVDVDKATELIDSIRTHLPEELEAARQLLADREALTAEADTQAREIVTNAQRQASSLVAEQAVYKTAERQARTMLEQAQARADQIRLKSDEYAVDSLRALEARLSQSLATVQNGIASLQSRTTKDE